MVLGGDIAGKWALLLCPRRELCVQMATIGDNTAALLITLNSEDSVNLLLDTATLFYDMGNIVFHMRLVLLGTRA